MEEIPSKFKKPQRSQLIIDDQLQKNLKNSKSGASVRSALVLSLDPSGGIKSRSNIMLNPNYAYNKSTRDLTANETLMAADPLPGVPPGLELLVPLNFISVRRRPETDTILIAVDAPLNYEICDARGHRMYNATEKSDAAALHCLGNLRAIEINIVDFLGRTVMRLEKPCDWKLYCTMLPCFCCIFGSIGGRMRVSLEDGSKLGEIVHRYHCYRPWYKVLDSNGEHIMTIKGRCGPDCCMYNCWRCRDIEFHITRANDKTEIGHITQGYAGTLNNKNLPRPRSEIEDEDEFQNFGVVFPTDMNSRTKALMLAASFLIHFMYYEVPRADRERPADYKTPQSRIN